MPLSLSPSPALYLSLCLKTKEDIDCSLQSMTLSDSAFSPNRLPLGVFPTLRCHVA